MKMVLYIDSMRLGGAERVMSILANSFADDGHDITLITDVPVEKNDGNYTLSDKIKCVWIKPKSTSFVFKNIQRLKQLRKIIRNEKPSVVLSFLGRQNYRMLIATLGLKCRKCISVRNDPNKEYGKTFLKKWIANRIFSFADVCVFQTNEARKYFNKKIQRKSVVIPNPIDEKFFKVGRVKEPRNIITIGRLEPQKNQKLLIDAFKLIADKIDDNLLIYGEGGLYKELRGYIDKVGMRDRIVLMGKTKSIEKELAKAKLFVLSSDYEGMPNALIEAMAVGVPCVATDCPCGGPGELLHREALVECGNSVELSKKILLFYNKNDNRALEEMLKQRIIENRLNKIIPKWFSALGVKVEETKSQIVGQGL